MGELGSGIGLGLNRDWGAGGLVVGMVMAAVVAMVAGGGLVLASDFSN